MASFFLYCVVVELHIFRIWEQKIPCRNDGLQQKPRQQEGEGLNYSESFTGCVYGFKIKQIPLTLVAKLKPDDEIQQKGLQ
jgi:hypothetical protein